MIRLGGHVTIFSQVPARTLLSSSESTGYKEVPGSVRSFFVR